MPTQLKSLETQSQKCITSANKMADAFSKVLNMTIELNTCCSATQGSQEIAEKDAEMMKTYLQTQKDQMAKDVEKQDKYLTNMKANYEDVSLTWYSPISLLTPSPFGSEPKRVQGLYR